MLAPHQKSTIRHAAQMRRRGQEGCFGQQCGLFHGVLVWRLETIWRFGALCFRLSLSSTVRYCLAELASE
jgi:hypothetical protein